jgi:Tol biopolymer transport system component/DNA-binding winged helix-turn-helix (wHTH) protein
MPPNLIYEFGGFRLDRDERVLRRGDVPVPLTPKATEILLTLVDRHGHIVEKAELMRRVWPDVAVEESNLTQNVYTLRQVLTNGDGGCALIETVPRRGYRFVGPVTVVSETGAAAGDPMPPAAGGAVATPPAASPTWRRAIAWPAALLGTGVIAAAASWVVSNGSSTHVTTPPSPAPLTRVTHLGNIVRAAVLPDGRSLVYAAATGSGESLWARDLDSANPIQLIAPAVGTYRRGGGLSPGPDGWVYYTWFRADLAAVGVYRIRQGGGQPERLRTVWDLPSFDPAGRRFACISTTSMPIGESRLLLYDASGGSERVVSLRKPPETFVQMRPAWSPDGTQLAAWTQDGREPGLLKLVLVRVRDGRERVVTQQALHAVDSMVWLRDGSSVVVAAREAAATPLRLWQIELARATMRPLTTDISDYLLAGLTGDGQRLAAVRVDVARSLWVAPVTDLARARQVASDAGELSELESLSWTADDRVLYTSTESGNADIWVFDPATGARRQLTKNPRDDFTPVGSPDGRTIVFASNRSGATGLWAMSEAGEASARQLTDGGDSRPSISAGGAVVFQRGVIQSSPIELWRLPLAGGAATRLTEDVSIRPSVSPDGRMVAYYWLTPSRWTLAVVPLDGGHPLQLFPLSSTHCGRTVRWSPDSRSVAYIDCAGGEANIWTRRLGASSATRLTDFKSSHITTFDWSRDGSQLAWITRHQVSDVVLMDVPRPAPEPPQRN